MSVSPFPTPAEQTSETAERHRVLPIRPRKMNFPFGTHIPRHWIRNSAVLSHAINGLNLVFPEGEQFFIRSVRRYAEDTRNNPVLWKQVKGFMAQEVRHGIEHHRFFATLEAQGYNLEPILRPFERFMHRLEGVLPAGVLLAGTVALEHYTATLGDLALRTDLLDDCDPDVGALLRWHAAEEIEHKAVAMDVFEQSVDSYPIRMTGFALATAGLLGWWLAAWGMLLAKDIRDGRVESLRHEVQTLVWAFVGTGVAKETLKAALDFMRPRFHPRDVDNLALAEDYLSQLAA